MTRLRWSGNKQAEEESREAFNKSKNKHNKVVYAEYIKSKSWAKKRNKIFKRDNYLCIICSSNKNLQAHHLTYDRLGYEKLTDLITVCTICHNKIHNKLLDKKILIKILRVRKFPSNIISVVKNS